MKFIQKFSIFLNSTKFPNGPSALQYLQNLIIRKEEIDQQLLIQQLKENKNKIIQSFRFDSYQLVKFVKCAQLVTKQQLEDYQQPLLNIINNKFPSKIFLLQCLQLNLECNIDDIKTIPNNNNSQLISACLNALVKNYWLDYKEATAVLHYLHNQKVLKLLLNCEWVKSYIIQSQEGLNNSNLKNLALLSRIYADIGPSYLIKIAETVEKINFDDDHNNNQLSYITLYYTLSILKNYSLLLKKISNKIILTKNMDQQSLMQLLIGVSQSKDKEFVKQLFQYLNIETLNEIDMGLYYLCGTYFNLIQKDKILNDISNQFLFTIIKRMKHKQIGELCINLWNKYEINIIHFFLNNQDLIDSSNIVNLYLIDKEKSLNLKIQIEQNLMQKNIDLPGMMKLSQLKEFQYILSEAIIQFNYEDIKYHIKELSSILLHIEPYINDLSQLLEMITQAIYEQHSRVIGFGNIIYIASKKNKKFIPAISNNIFSQMIKQCDAIELINLLKGLYNFNLLTKEDYDKIMLSIKQKTNEGNKLRVERNLSKLPKLIHSF